MYDTHYLLTVVYSSIPIRITHKSTRQCIHITEGIFLFVFVFSLDDNEFDDEEENMAVRVAFVERKNISKVVAV